MLLPRGSKGKDPEGVRNALYCTLFPILLEMLTQKNYTQRSQKVIPGSASSFVGQKGNEGHLLMRVIKQALITSKAPLVIAVSQIKESHPRKRDQTLY